MAVPRGEPSSEVRSKNTVAVYANDLHCTPEDKQANPAGKESHKSSAVSPFSVVGVNMTMPSVDIARTEHSCSSDTRSN